MNEPQKTTGLHRQIALCTKAQWMIGIVIVAIALGFALLAYLPRSSLLARLQSRINGDRRELTTNQSRATALPAVALEVEQLRGQLRNFDRRMPAHPELADFLRSVNEISHEAQLRKISVRQGASRRQTLFSAQPIELRFEGEFSRVWTFLDRMESLPRLTRVQRLKIKGIDARQGTVDVELALEIYFVDG